MKVFDACFMTVLFGLRYTGSNRTKPWCDPGQYLTHDEYCANCPEGEGFTETKNRYESCTSCTTTCDKYKKILPCNRTHDIVCGCPDHEMESFDGCIKRNRTMDLEEIGQNLLSSMTEMQQQNRRQAEQLEQIDFLLRAIPQFSKVLNATFERVSVKTECNICENNNKLYELCTHCMWMAPFAILIAFVSGTISATHYHFFRKLHKHDLSLTCCIRRRSSAYTTECDLLRERPRLTDDSEIGRNLETVSDLEDGTMAGSVPQRMESEPTTAVDINPRTLDVAPADEAPVHQSGIAVHFDPRLTDDSEIGRNLETVSDLEDRTMAGSVPQRMENTHQHSVDLPPDKDDTNAKTLYVSERHTNHEIVDTIELTHMGELEIPLMSSVPSTQSQQAESSDKSDALAIISNSREATDRKERGTVENSHSSTTESCPTSEKWMALLKNKEEDEEYAATESTPFYIM